MYTYYQPYNFDLNRAQRSYFCFNQQAYHQDNISWTDISNAGLVVNIF